MSSLCKNHSFIKINPGNVDIHNVAFFIYIWEESTYTIIQARGFPFFSDCYLKISWKRIKDVMCISPICNKDWHGWLNLCHLSVAEGYQYCFYYQNQKIKVMYWNREKRIQVPLNSIFWNRLELSKSFYNDLLNSFLINKYRFWGIMSDSSLNWNSAKFDASKKWCRFPMKINSVACKSFAYFQCCICLMYVQCTWKSWYQYCWPM